MADPKGKRGDRRATHDIAPIVRRAWVRALARVSNGEENEEVLATMIEKSFEKDFLQTMSVMAKFNPRESNVKLKADGLADALREINERTAQAGHAELSGQDPDLAEQPADICH